MYVRVLQLVPSMKLSHPPLSRYSGTTSTLFSSSADYDPLSSRLQSSRQSSFVEIRTDSVEIPADRLARVPVMQPELLFCAISEKCF